MAEPEATGGVISLDQEKLNDSLQPVFVQPMGLYF